MSIDKTDCIIIFIYFSLFKISSIYFADYLKQHISFGFSPGKKNLLSWNWNPDDSFYGIFTLIVKYRLCIMLQILNHVISTFYNWSGFTYQFLICKNFHCLLTVHETQQYLLSKGAVLFCWLIYMQHTDDISVIE